MEISFRRVLSALLHLCHKVQVFKFIRLLSEREKYCNQEERRRQQCRCCVLCRKKVAEELSLIENSCFTFASSSVMIVVGCC